MHPLRSTKADGKAYERPAYIEVAIERLIEAGEREFVARCVIEDRSNLDYIPSECLLYFVRHRRGAMDPICYEAAFKGLIGRVLRALPQDPRTSENLFNEKVRERAYNDFLNLLRADHTEYCNRLDYFEVRFDGAMAGLRKSAQEAANRDKARLQAFADPDSEEDGLMLDDIPDEENPAPMDFLLQEDFRERLRDSIDKLTPNEGRAVHMFLQEIPIESSDPEKMTMSSVLGKTPRMIRYYLSRAFATLRQDLTEREVSL